MIRVSQPRISDKMVKVLTLSTRTDNKLPFNSKYNNRRNSNRQLEKPNLRLNRPFKSRHIIHN